MKSSLFDKTYYTTGAYDDYQFSFKGRGRSFINLVRAQLAIGRDWKILDVGCGLGGTVFALRQQGFQAFGTEISPYCLELSPVKEYLYSASVVNLPFADNSFDLIICKDVLCYLSLPEIETAVSELARVALRYVYIEVISRNSPNSSQKLNPDRLRPSRSLLTVSAWLKLLRMHGLKPLLPIYTPVQNPDFHYLCSKL